MRKFFAALKQIMVTILSTMKLVSREVWDAGIWVTKLTCEVIRVPVRAVCQVADGLLNLVDRPEPSANTKADEARNTTERQVRAANGQVTREQAAHDLARLVQRTSRFRELGHASAKDLAAELPDVLRAWVRRLSTDECGKLAAMDTRAVVEYLKKNDIYAELPGIQPIAFTPPDVAARFEAAASGRRASGAEQTPEEQAVLSRLAERIKARKAQQAVEEDDELGFVPAR
jgi:uncharacterized protein (DUF2267 family)